MTMAELDDSDLLPVLSDERGLEVLEEGPPVYVRLMAGLNLRKGCLVIANEVLGEEGRAEHSG